MSLIAFWHSKNQFPQNASLPRGTVNSFDITTHYAPRHNILMVVAAYTYVFCLKYNILTIKTSCTLSLWDYATEYYKNMW